MGAISDWRNGEITTFELFEVINFFRTGEPLLEVGFTDKGSPAGERVTVDQVFLNEDIDFAGDAVLDENLTVAVQNESGDLLSVSEQLGTGTSTDVVVDGLGLSADANNLTLTAALFDSTGTEALLAEGAQVEQSATVDPLVDGFFVFDLDQTEQDVKIGTGENATFDVAAEAATEVPINGTVTVSEVGGDFEETRNLSGNSFSVQVETFEVPTENQPAGAEVEFNVTLETPGDPVFTTSNSTVVTVQDLTFNEQVLGTSNGSDAVQVQDVNADAGQTVEVQNASGDVVGSVTLDGSVDGGSVAVPVTTTPGEHTAELLTADGDVVTSATATVFSAALNITDQQFEDSTTTVEVNTSDVQPESESDYQVIIHENTAGLPVLGNSTVVSGAQDDLTVTLDQEIDQTTDVLAMLHFPDETSDFGSPIPVLDGSSFSQVTDTATVEIQQAEGGNVEFQDQVLGTSGGSPAVLAENVSSVDVVTVDNAFDPQDDFLVLTNGTEVTGPDNVLDSVQVSEFSDGDDVALNATGATPGQHTVVLHEPNEAGDGPDPTAPRTDASTGEVVSATATVFDGSVTITDQQYEDSTSEITVDASDLQPAGASDYKIVVHNQTGVPAGGVGPAIGFSANLTGAQTDVPVSLTETLSSTTDVLTMIHFPGDPTGPPIPTLNNGAFGIGDDQAGTVTDTATIEIQQAEGGNVEFQDQVLGTSGGSPAVLAESVSSVDVVTVDDAFDPQDDFLVLTEGQEVTGPGDVLDSVQVSEFSDGDDVALNATGATPGEHTVVLHEPNEAGDGPDPTAPRTDASTGEVVSATATVFDAALDITDQQYEANTTTVEVDTTDLQPASESDYQVIIHENTAGLPVLGNSTVVSGAQDNLTVTLDQEIDQTTDVLAMLHFPDETSDFGSPIPVLDGSSFSQVTDTATVEIEPLTGGIEGSVETSGDVSALANIEGATVEIYFSDRADGSFDATQQPDLSRTTDGGGNFGFDADTIPLGDHVIRANADGFAPTALNLTVSTQGVTNFGAIELDDDSIQAAIDRAERGDTIDISAGTYNEDVEINGVDQLLILGAGNGTDGTVITGDVTLTQFNGDNRIEDLRITGNLTVDSDNNVFSGVTVEGNYIDNGAGNRFVDSTQSIEGDAILRGSNSELRNVAVTGSIEVDGPDVSISDTSVGNLTVTENGDGASLNNVQADRVDIDENADNVSQTNVTTGTNFELDSAEFDNGNTESDSVTILGNFLNTIGDTVGSIIVGFGNIAGNVGLGNVGVGNIGIEIGNTDLGNIGNVGIGNVDVGNTGDGLTIDLDGGLDLSNVDDDASINITIDDIDTTETTDNGNVNVGLEDENGDSIAENETESGGL